MIVILAAVIGPVEDPDFWWHLRTGQWMLQHVRLPATDLYTYTVPRHLWTDHEYLTEILMALVYGLSGLNGIAVAFGAITWAAFFVLYKSAHSERQPYVIVGLVMALAALAGGPIWGPRAQMITFLLTCLELYWLRGYLEGRSRAIKLFPLVMALWANLHGGWVIGFAFLGIAIGAQVMAIAIDRKDAAPRRRLRTLAIVTGLSVLAVMATPNGLAIYVYPFQTQGSFAQQSLIVEWFSPNFHLAFMRPYELMLLLVFTGFVLRRPTLYDFTLSVFVLLLSLESVRHVALFVAATTPILIVTWADVWRELSAKRGWKLQSAAPRPALMAMTALVLLMIAGATAFRIGDGFRRQPHLIRSDYPVAASDWLAAHPEVGTRMYNQYGWGGYLADRFYPDPNRRVFIFGEAALMGDHLLNQYQDVQTLRPDWRQVLDSYGVDYIVYNRGEALSNVLLTEPDWKVAHQDDVTVIFVKRTPG